MARLSSETVERVKEAADMVEIVSAHTDLRRAGQRFVGLCPFHDERTPSFSVDPAEKLYYCFGCEAGGDVFRFVQEKEGLSFRDAVEALAERYGVELEREREDPRAEAARRRRARLGELLERTAAFYAEFLWGSPKAARAREYLRGRGLAEATLRQFGVGFAPSAWDQVLTRGQRAGFSIEELLAAGLIQRGRKGGYYDRFRARIIFPIRDPRGRVVGFGGRALSPDSKPKYLNSPEGELYRKSETLYGIDRARAPIAKAGRAIVVEGYTDAIALHQVGMEEAVAIMGTAITPDQLRTLSGLTDTVVLALDADRAGADAMIRAQRVAGDRRLELQVAAMSADADPAEMVAGGEVERFRSLVAGAVDVARFQVLTTLDRADLASVGGRERALGDVVPVVRSTVGTVGHDELIRLVADRLDTDPSLVARRVEEAPAVRDGEGWGAGGGSAQAAGGEGVGAPEAPAALTPHERRERALLAMCVADREAGSECLRRLDEEHMSSPAARRALVWLREHLDDPIAGLPHEDGELVSLVTQIVISAEREPATAEAMELNYMLLEQRRLEDRIADAHAGGDLRRASELARERASLVDRIARAAHPAA